MDRTAQPRRKARLDAHDARRLCPALALSPRDPAYRLPADGGAYRLLIAAAAADKVPPGVLAAPDVCSRSAVERLLSHPGAPDSQALAAAFAAPPPPPGRSAFAATAEARRWLTDAVLAGRLRLYPWPETRPRRPAGRYTPPHTPTEDEWHRAQRARDALASSAALAEAGRALREAPEPPPADPGKPAAADVHAAYQQQLASGNVSLALDADNHTLIESEQARRLQAAHPAPPAPALPRTAAPTAADPSTRAAGCNGTGHGCQPAEKACTGGDPIDLATGEELLQLTDFTLDGPLPFAWTRTYRSSNSARDGGLGHGWNHPLGVYLAEGADVLTYHDAEGRAIAFPRPAVGGRSHNRADGLTLHRLAAHRYGLGRTQAGGLEYHFSGADEGHYHLHQIRDGSGNTLRLHYADGRPARLSCRTGAALRFGYGPHGRLRSITALDAGGRAVTRVQYAYSAAGDLISATDAGGHSERYRYSGHLLRERTLKSGYRFHFHWDGRGPAARCSRQHGDPMGGAPTYDYRFSYNSDTTTVTDTRGATHRYRFNASGQPLHHIDAEGGEHHYRYDADGRLLSQTDPLGGETRYHYNAGGQPTTLTDPSGATHHFAYDTAGRLTTYTDPLGQAWQRHYDARGRLTEVRDPLGHGTRYRYNALGLPGAVIDPGGATTRYLWDDSGRLTTVQDAEGRAIHYRRDAGGRLMAILGAGGATRYDYDDQDRVIAIHAPAGGTTRYAYTPLGQLASITDPAGRTTAYSYDGLSQIRRRRDPGGTVLDYHYDGERNLIALTNQKGERHQLTYDRNERLTEETGFDGRISRYRYNAAGHLIERAAIARGAEGEQLLAQTHYQRDPLGRLREQHDPDGTTHYSYDALGRLTEARNAHRHLHWHFDAAGRLVEDWQDATCLRHAHDATGRRIRTELPDGQHCDYRYDAAGALSQLRHNGRSLLRLKRDQAGRESARRFGNAVESARLYDPQGRLIGEKRVQYPDPWNADNTIGALVGELFGKPAAPLRTLHQRSYHYNTAGQLARIHDSRRGTTVYHYDPLERLTRVDGPVPETLLHDPAHNLLGDTAAADAAPGNRLTVHGDARYTYDAHGNRIHSARGKGGRRETHYRYDARHRLTEVTTPSAHVTYRYDPLGRRIAKRTADGETQFLWDGDVLLQEHFTPAPERNTEAPPPRTYLFEPGTFRPVALLDGETTYYYHLDHLGTPLELTDA
ncbi:MAG: DUF6531 domain-containing protein, partial [Aquisalimonadaceae bacterium]